jgi:hypothetical protein
MRRLLTKLPEGCSMSFHKAMSGRSVELACTEHQRQQLKNSKMRVYVEREEDGRLKVKSVTVMKPALAAITVQQADRATPPKTNSHNGKEKPPKIHRHKDQSNRRSS